MAVRDSVKIVSRAKPHVSRELANIANAIEDTSPSNLRRLERARRFLNAIGFSVRAKVTGAVEAEVLTALENQQNSEDFQELQALAEEAADRLTLSDIQEIKDRIDKAKNLRRLRREKFGDRAIRRIAREGVSAKAPLMGEFTESSMGLARSAHPRVWVWTANASACAVCLSLHGSRREGPFNPPHPNCLCIPEAPGGPSRPLTDDEIGDQMIKRGGRDAKLGRALKDGQISRGQLRIRREGIIKQRNFDIPDTSGATAHYRNPDFLDNVGAAETEDFFSGFAQAKRGKYGAFLDDLDQSHFDADNIRTYTAFDGKVGVALIEHDDGRIEIGSLFASPDAPDGAGRDMLRFVVRERDGNWLNNFDGPLTEFYREEGFEVVARAPFDPKFAPAGWDFDRFGTPDYVEMAKVTQ